MAGDQPYYCYDYQYCGKPHTSVDICLMEIYSYEVMKEIGPARARRFRQGCRHVTSVELIKLSRIQTDYRLKDHCKLQMSRYKCQFLHLPPYSYSSRVVCCGLAYSHVHLKRMVRRVKCYFVEPHSSNKRA